MEESIVERMFRIMIEKNIKAVALANILSVSTGAITNWKKRGTNPPVEFTTQICELLDISIYYYLYGEEKIQNELTQEELKLLKNFNHCPRIIKDMILDNAEKGAAVAQQEQKENLSTSKIG